MQMWYTEKNRLNLEKDKYLDWNVRYTYNSSEIILLYIFKYLKIFKKITGIQTC